MASLSAFSPMSSSMASFGPCPGSPAARSFRQTTTRPNRGSFPQVALFPRGSKYCSTATLASLRSHPLNTPSKYASVIQTFLSRRRRRTIIVPRRQLSCMRNKRSSFCNGAQLCSTLVNNSSPRLPRRCVHSFSFYFLSISCKYYTLLYLGCCRLCCRMLLW